MPAIGFEKIERTAKNVAETQAYLDKVWKEKVRWIWKLAFLAVAIFLVSVGFVYLSLAVPSATLYRPIAHGLCGVSVFIFLVICVGYWFEKLSHAQKSAGMLKISRQ